MGIASALLKHATGTAEMSIVASGDDGRKVVAESATVGIDMGKGFFISESEAKVFCQLMACQHGGMPGSYVREQECKGLPDRLSPKKIESETAGEYKHHYSCIGCMYLKTNSL